MVLTYKLEMEGARALILSEEYNSSEGVCLGKQSSRNRWAVSLDGSEQVLSLRFESDFAFLVDLSTNQKLN